MTGDGRILLNMLETHQLSEQELWKARIDVVAAMIDALRRHGRPTSDPGRGIATLTEELGEAAAHALEATRGSITATMDMRASGHAVAVELRGMYDELAQLTGYGMLLMMSMRKLYKEVECQSDPASQS